MLTTIVTTLLMGPTAGQAAPLAAPRASADVRLADEIRAYRTPSALAFRRRFDLLAASASRRAEAEASRMRAEKAAPQPGATSKQTRTLLKVPPKVRAQYENEARLDAIALDSIRKVARGGDLSALRTKMLGYVDSGELNVYMTADIAMHLGQVDLRLGKNSEAYELISAALPYASRKPEPQDESLVFASIAAARMGKTFPFQSDYLGMKLQRATRLGHSAQVEAFVPKGQSAHDVLLASYLFIADGAGGSRNMDIAPYCAEEALKLEPDNPVVLSEFAATHRQDEPSLVRRLIAARDRLAAGPLRNELSEIVSPGSTASRP